MVKGVKTSHRRVLLFNKPYGVLCQFSREGDTPVLSDFIDVKEVYPAGRLDKDSEGLMVLTNDGALQARISSPKFKLAKTYWVEVEGLASPSQIKQLQSGVKLRDGWTKPAQVSKIKAPNLWPRNPPVRFRANVPTSWLALTIYEGRNRQVRRMTAALDLPTLRLVRVQIGHWRLNGLAVGQWRELRADEIKIGV